MALKNPQGFLSACHVMMNIFFQEWDPTIPGLNVSDPRTEEQVRNWSVQQDKQQILVTTPSVVLGERLKVYRAEGTTQWYTAVTSKYRDDTGVRKSCIRIVPMYGARSPRDDCAARKTCTVDRAKHMNDDTFAIKEVFNEMQMFRFFKTLHLFVHGHYRYEVFQLPT